MLLSNHFCWKGNESNYTQKSLLTISEVAHLLSIKQSTIRSWIHQNRISVVRLGRNVRIKNEDVKNGWLRGYLNY